ncbi:2-isopropylmalate synthase [Ruminococcaceae bacterium OttesenSCG-928-A16]|nr:2-isopropylmalate synthase [Ruminococcaceae bacterium OttesenSCG-928-A16]
MKNFDKYAPGFFAAPQTQMRWAQKNHIEQAPIWCSVDLRDGNQSLVVPMSLEQKLDFFSFLVKVGFKEIEVGFPAASETEFELLRALIERGLVPDDVTLQVLTQCREHIIRKTFEALKGAKSAVVHFYNSTSFVQRQQVFRKSKQEVKQIAVEGAKLVKKLAGEYEGNFRFEYSPESFTGTEPEYALEVCNAVLDELQPGPDNIVIINLPGTVEMSMPHVYANQIEYMSDNLKYREYVQVSLHPHNDRGCAVADAELGLLAGANRVEGTLFGNGERTGNVDIVTLALNMFSQGVNPGLNFSNMPAVVSAYEEATDMQVPPRQPYAGALVFAAFSGSHQDAIAKGMQWRKEQEMEQWAVPYLPINPADVGREYETDVIRINSQSGKGGIGYLLEQNYGYSLPPKMREDFGYVIKNVSDHEHRELSPAEVKAIFEKTYLNISAPIDVSEVHFIQKNGILAAITVRQNGQEQEYTSKGNGRLDAVSNALRQGTGQEFSVLTYAEHALETGSSSKAVAYVGLTWADGTVTWGAGQHTDIILASVTALVSAYNNKA